MNQEKIGKFIALRRKEMNLTQADWAERLGVTDRSISNWENGKCMPDYSLLIPLSKELDVSVNDLISGEILDKNNYEKKCDENIINVIGEQERRLNKRNMIIGFVIFVIGFLIMLSAIMIFPSESSWSSIYSIFGAIVTTIGFTLIFRKLNFRYRIAFLFILIAFLFLIDFVNVKLNSKAPMFSMYTTTIDDTILYDTPFYDVYRCRKNSKDEYYVIVSNHEYDEKYIMNFCKTNH